jgi:signal transduction histidine kinase
MKEKIAIICPIGKTGNVVTMTLNYYLRSEEGLNLEDAKLIENAGKTVWISKDNQGKITVTQDKSDDLEFIVIIPHTQVAVYPGVKKRKDGIDSAGNIIISTERKERREGELQKQWNCGDWDTNTEPIIWSGTGYKWHPKIAGLPHPNYNQMEPTILENIACYLIPIHTKTGNEILPDIYDIPSNDQFQDLTYGLCAVLNRQGYNIHISLAGGRKTMSAYQMTSATLFPVKARLSHVLEPTIEKLNRFIEDNNLNILDRDRVLNRITAAYQPYPELYESVPVQHINLSDVTDAIFNLLNFRPVVEGLIRPEGGIDLGKASLEELLLDKDNRLRVYQIGAVYRDKLSEVDKFMGNTIRRGISGGMLRSFLKHEVKDSIFRHMRDALQGMVERRVVPSQIPIEAQNILSQLNLLDDTLSAIQLAADLEPEQLQEKIEEKGVPRPIVEIIEQALSMYEVKDSMYDEVRNPLGRIVIDKQYQIEASVKCIPNVLALAFNNIVRNFKKEVKKLIDKKTAKERYTMKIHANGVDTWLTLRFEDDGQGFDKKEWPDLEQLFDWGSSTNRKEAKVDDEHQGLGLPMARKIVEAHCGKIWAEHNQPNGAVFVITLPLT